MNTFLWTVVIFVVFYWISMIAVVLWAYKSTIRFWIKFKTNRERLVRAIFLMPNGFMLDDEYFLTNEYEMISYDGGDYQVEKKKGFFSTKKNILTMVYLYKNPCPINFKEMNNKNIPDYDSVGLQKALQEKFIKDLLQEQDKMLLIVILVAVNILISIVTAVYTTGLIKPAP